GPGAGVHPARLAARQPGRAGVPHELLRGRGVRALGRCAAADRGRVGARGGAGGNGRRRGAGAASARAGCRRQGRIRAAAGRGLGMDLKRLWAVPGLPAVAGRGGRVQRQVHERPVGAARRQLRDAAGARARQLPQLLPLAGALAVHRPAAGQGRMNFSTPANPDADLVDLQPGPERITADVVAGLSASPRRLPSKYFYDARGSELFEQITRQPEYYLTRVEIALMDARMADIAAAVGPALHVVEYGSGSGRKTEILLAGLDEPVAYTPIEISRDALLHSVARLEGVFPDIEMLPVCADFTRP